MCAVDDIIGFSLPGKPGVVVVEGDENNVKEFLTVIRVSRYNTCILTVSVRVPALHRMI